MTEFANGLLGRLFLLFRGLVVQDALTARTKVNFFAANDLVPELRAAGHDPAADLRYLRQWAANRSGVEAFVEPKTAVTDVTVVLVAANGEWTRRRAGGDAGARRLSERLNIPVYDVQKVGYPQRMRDYDERRRIERRRAARNELEER